MIKIKLWRILAVFGLSVLVVSGYVGWQVYKGQQMANQFAADAQKLAQESAQGPASSNAQALGSRDTTPPTTIDQTSPAQTYPAQKPSALNPDLLGAQANSSTPSPSGTSNSQEYKQLMAKTYQQTLETMQNVKSNTIALQGQKLSLSAYKASILQSKATFSAAEAFVQANPPSAEGLKPSYQEFLAGISLAKQSMSVVLDGISAFSPTKFYAAREMGKKAQQQVVNGYSHL